MGFILFLLKTIIALGLVGFIILIIEMLVEFFM